MFLIFAASSTLATALGTFLTRSLIMKLPTYQIIGPLFILNAVAITPLILIRDDWVPLNFHLVWQILLLGILTALGGVFVFVVVKRSFASLSIVGATLSPALVLVLSPLFLHVHVRLSQFIIVGILVSAVLYPIRNSILGIHSTATLLMMSAQGINAGLVAILIAHLAKEGVGLSQFLFIQQIIAGILFLIFFWPKDLSLRSYPLLAKRSAFMSMGWFFAIVAINRGSALIVQSVLSATPLVIVLIETISYKRRPRGSIVFSALTIIACIVTLNFA